MTFATSKFRVMYIETEAPDTIDMQANMRALLLQWVEMNIDAAGKSAAIKEVHGPHGLSDPTRGPHGPH